MIIVTALTLITKNSNSVNIGPGQSSYHHGNLREALISTGLEILAKNSSDEFSLREVARSVGVSATSVYRHFADKQTFVEALCNEGNQMLATELNKAMSSHGGGQKGFDASGLAYVRFALSNSALFNLMRTAHSGFDDISSPYMQEVLSNVATLLPKSATLREKQVRALHGWSVVHGIAMLVLEGHMPDDDELIKSVIQTPKA